MGVLPENRSTDLQREKTGVCAIQDYSYHKDFNVNISSEKLLLYWLLPKFCIHYC